MAVVTVTRSSGQKVQIALGPISRQRDSVTIYFPGRELQPEQWRGAGHNAALTFARIVKGNRSWVKVIDRQPLAEGDDAVLHVSKKIFYRMARWACAILGCQRLMLQNDSEIEIPSTKIWWDVYWHADDGDHYQGSAFTTTASEACDQVAEIETMRDRMYAVPSHRPQTVTL